MSEKQWGKSAFWGVGSAFDPDWLINEEQRLLRDKLIDLCRRKIRPLAIISDQTYEFPRESLNALAELGLLGLIIPKEFGGLGQSHTCSVMIVETLARYGCPSTAMMYSMHLQTVAILLFRHHDNLQIQKLLRRVCSEDLVGSSAYSDAATGSHFWFPLSAKSLKINDDKYKLFKFNSWTTGAGFADFYVFQTPTPGDERDHGNLTGFFVFKDEVRASTDNWSSLGLHGNQSGPLIVEGVFDKSRMIGKPGEGQKNNDEVGAVFFLICTTSVWNGIAMGCIDVARRHTRQKTHGDLGLRVCDYPIVQDYVGASISKTNGCRAFIYMLTSEFDQLTNNNNWELHKDPGFMPRSAFGLWLMQAKHNASENVSWVADQMLKACGGDGYKTETGLERLLRDSKAGCLMAPTNEVIRGLVGKGALVGLDALDLWDKQFNDQLVCHEINKMSLEDKKDLMRRIGDQIQTEESSKSLTHPYQDTDFDNPFNTQPPKSVPEYKTEDGTAHRPALSQSSGTPLKLVSRRDVGKLMTSFVFGFARETDHSGCLPGQYIKVSVESEGRSHERYFSPVSPPAKFGTLELILKFETHGIVSKYFKELKIGEVVTFMGPCGGFEYELNQLEELTLIAAGSGVTPGLQLVRTLSSNLKDPVKVTLIYYSNSAEEILCKDELDNISKKDPRFKLVLTVGDAPEDWTNEVGFVDTDMIDKFVSKPNGLKHKIIICGGPTMSISCLHSLRKLRYSPEMIFIYGQFGTEQIRAVYGKHVKLSGHRCDNVV